MHRIVGLAGSLSVPSRTRALVEAAVDRAVDVHGIEGEVFDLRDFLPSLGTAMKLSELAPGARAAVDAILSADALVLASPVYKGSYAGMFKHLLDLLDPLSLAGKPILLAATGGGARHALVLEHQFRPLLGFFEAHSLSTSVYASDGDFTDGRLTDPAIRARLNRAVDQFAPFLRPSPERPFIDADRAVLAAPPL